MEEESYIIVHKRQKGLLIKCTRRNCNGSCDDIIFTKRECAENYIEGVLNRHYIVKKVLLKLI